MERIGTSDIFQGSIPYKGGWGEGTVVGYKINTSDSIGNMIETEYIYYFYASEIEMNTDFVDSAYVGDTKALTGNATYNGNESAPVEFSNVTVRIIETGSEYYSETDMNGEFIVPIEFETYGELHVNISLSNRTLVAHDEKSVFVTGISYLSEILQMTTCFPEQEIWVNGTSMYNTGEPVIFSPIKIYISHELVWYGETDSEGNYSILITAPDESGLYNVIVSIHNDTLEHLNTTAITVTDVPIADLIVRDEQLTFSSEKDPPLESEEVNITAIVHNLGTADCTNVLVNFYKGSISTDNLIGSYIIPLMAVGQTEKAYFVWNATNGTHGVLVVVDPEDTFSESFEDNNEATISIFVDADTDSDGVGNLEDEDDDGDGLSDIEEEELDTDPLKKDTDGDGVDDKQDYDPLDPKVTEEPSQMPWSLIIIVIVVVIVIIISMGLFIKKKRQEKS
jgi:hypothetical protein